jgi:Ca2+-binding EF-hand superfamily protein
MEEKKSLTLDQLIEFKTAFEVFDTDNDGIITN